jgi:hypothetical protein
MIRISRLLLGAYAARSLYVTGSMLWSWRRMRNELTGTQSPPDDHTPALTVVIPALCEQEVMPRALRHFAELAAHWPGLRVMVVTAARERAQTPAGQPTTEDLCQALASEHNERIGREVFHITCFPGQGRRASQLNHALAVMEELIPSTRNDYVAVFDADAIPDARPRAHFARAAADRPAMIQMPMLPAFRSRIAPRRSAVMAGQDLASFRRTVGIEYRRIHMARLCAPGRRMPVLAALARPMVYGVGSGLIVRRDKIADVGYFQEPHDDLAVGHRLSLAGEPIAALPCVNIVEPYRSVASLAQAFASVAFANTATRHDHRFAATHPSRLSRPEQQLLTTKALADGALWALGPSLMTVAAAVGVRRAKGPLAAALLLSGVVEPLVAYTLRAQILADFHTPGEPEARWEQPRIAAAVTTSLLQPAISSLGPWLLGLRACAARLGGRELEFTKAQHLGEIAQ